MTCDPWPITCDLHFSPAEFGSELPKSVKITELLRAFKNSIGNLTLANVLSNLITRLF